MILCAGKKDEHVELLELASSGIHVAEYLADTAAPQVARRKTAPGGGIGTGSVGRENREEGLMKNSGQGMANELEERIAANVVKYLEGVAP